MTNSYEKHGDDRAGVMRSDDPQIPFPKRFPGMSRQELCDLADIGKIAATQRWERQREEQLQKEALMPPGETPTLSPYMPHDMLAEAMRHYMHPGCSDYDIVPLIHYLGSLVPEEGQGDSGSQMLMASQAQVLNAIFCKLLQAASMEKSTHYDLTGIAAALMAQRQCRQNIEILHNMRTQVASIANKVKELENAN